MQYRVSTTTNKPGQKLLTYITAENLESVKTRVEFYNNKHTEWDMRLIQSVGLSDNVLMPIEYI